MNPGERLARLIECVSRRRRLRCYRKARAAGLVVAVSEGDSWFQYPLIQCDIVDHLYARMAVRSLGEGGQSLDDILRQGEIGGAVRSEDAKAVLISGGGNDLLVDRRLCNWIRDFDPALGPADYPNEHFLDMIEDLRVRFEAIIADAEVEVPVLVHGYDDMIPRRGGPYLDRPFRAKGIRDRELQTAIFAAMNQRFNAMLQAIAVAHPGTVLYADLRGTLGAHEWVDELHPTNEGYRRLANRVLETLAAAGVVRAEPIPRARFPASLVALGRDVCALLYGRIAKPDLLCRLPRGAANR